MPKKLKKHKRPTTPIPRVECGVDLFTELYTSLQFALTGQNVYYGDSLNDLVERHAPELFQKVQDAGFKLIPNTDPAWLEQQPPEFWFDVIRDSSLN